MWLTTQVATINLMYLYMAHHTTKLSTKQEKARKRTAESSLLFYDYRQSFRRFIEHDTLGLWLNSFWILVTEFKKITLQ